MVSWIGRPWLRQAAAKAIVNRKDAKGLKIRGGSREFDMLLQAAGATTLSTPSNELLLPRCRPAPATPTYTVFDQPDFVPA
jgi:hypothetical protein